MLSVFLNLNIFILLKFHCKDFFEEFCRDQRHFIQEFRVCNSFILVKVINYISTIFFVDYSTIFIYPSILLCEKFSVVVFMGINFWFWISFSKYSLANVCRNQEHFIGTMCILMHCSSGWFTFIYITLWNIDLIWPCLTTSQILWTSLWLGLSVY